jgi:hypothetical protein
LDGKGASGVYPVGETMPSVREPMAAENSGLVGAVENAASFGW